jgi:hypothetical protein
LCKGLSGLCKPLSDLCKAFSGILFCCCNGQ